MARPKGASFAIRLEAAGEAGELGPHGASIAATLIRVASLSDVAVKRLAEIQLAANEPDLRFYRAWQDAHERARLPQDLLVFQHIVSWSYSAADRRLVALPAELPTPAAQAFRHAVAGRALALAAGPDTPADHLMALSNAWTTVVG